MHSLYEVSRFNNKKIKSALKYDMIFFLKYDTIFFKCKFIINGISIHKLFYEDKKFVLPKYCFKTCSDSQAIIHQNHNLNMYHSDDKCFLYVSFTGQNFISR